MLTLSKVKRDIVKYGKFLTLGFILIIGLFLLIKIFWAVKESFFPTVAPPPNVAFGILPKIGFALSAGDRNLSYTLDTLTGGLPTFADRENVYKTQSYSANLLDLENAQDQALSLNFISPGTALSERNYQWDDGNRTLNIDIITRDFTLSSPFITTGDVPLIAVDEPSQAIDTANNFLNRASLMPSDIDTTKTMTSLFTVQNGALVPAQSLSNAKVISVNYFQNDINKIPVFYPNGRNSTMRFLIGRADSTLEVIEGHFYHQYATSESATYPLISPSEAFSRLKRGEAYIASYGGISKNILIKNVTMGYFIGEEKQEFIMPIIVFIGTNDFLAYVPAIKDEWIDR